MPISDPLLLAALALTAVAVGSIAFWIVAASRLLALQRNPPSVRRGLDLDAPAEGWPSVSIVIPAHNEERVIESCVAEVRRLQYPNFDVTFVLDRCTDRTRAILEPHAAEDPRIRILDNDSCPADWAGKCHAAHLGAKQATGDVLVFTDADTQFDPELIRCTVAIAAHDDRQLVSILSTLSDDRTFERIAQPVASIQLMNQYPIARVNRRVDPRPFANGQFLQFDRATYERIGGHEGVKDDLLEDIAFARRVKKHGGSGAILLADGMLRCSMYDSWDAFVRGWKRIFIEACTRSPRRLRKYGLRLLVAGAVVPASLVAGLIVGVLMLMAGETLVGTICLAAVGISLALQAWTLVGCYRLAGAPPRRTIWFPLGCILVGFIQLRAASDLVRRRPVRWGGRQYVLEPSTS